MRAAGEPRPGEGRVNEHNVQMGLRTAHPSRTLPSSLRKHTGFRRSSLRLRPRPGAARGVVMRAGPKVAAKCMIPVKAHREYRTGCDHAMNAAAHY